MSSDDKGIEYNIQYRLVTKEIVSCQYDVSLIFQTSYGSSEETTEENCLCKNSLLISMNEFMIVLILEKRNGFMTLLFINHNYVPFVKYSHIIVSHLLALVL